MVENRSKMTKRKAFNAKASLLVGAKRHNPATDGNKAMVRLREGKRGFRFLRIELSLEMLEGG